ncbi:MAG: type IV secretion system DNA-binding domain-containing protein, partial [Ignavibacteriales bacterium]|nr:type IV secretion system DNA-binding domain-containing protein [Ignavibacteriales bacterium]
KKNADIWAAVTAPGNVIAGRLRQTKGGERGYRYIEDASSKQAMSVFSVLMQYVKATEFMTEADGDFSVGRWLEDKKPGFIFITNYSSVRDTLRPILSLFIDLMGRRLLSMSEDYNRRVFFMLDEFGTLQRLSTIVELLTLSRSKGGAVFLGIQDVGQIDKIYRHETRQSIVNACGTNVIFSVGDPDTARFLSDKVGDTEVLSTDETHSMGPSDQRDGLSLIRKTNIEKLVLPSDIQNMQDLTAYVKLPNYDVVPVQFKYKRYPALNNPFMMNACFSLSGNGLDQGQGGEEVTDGEKVLRESEVEKERSDNSRDLELIEQETNI